MARYVVIVGNLGTVYTGPSQDEAYATFEEYRTQSADGYGRVSGESVRVFEDDSIAIEYIGTLDQED